MSHLKGNRPFSFFVIFFVYVVALIGGIVGYSAFDQYDLWLRLLIADVVATAITFLFSTLLANASVYDPYWSVQPIIIAIAFALMSPSLGLAQILPLIAVIIWGVRLTANWAYTFHGLDIQDWRYTMLKQKTGLFYPLVNFFGIHLFPTLVVYACTLPVVYTMIYAPSFNVGSIIFFLVSLAAVGLQGYSDYLMHKFRKSGQKGFNRSGTWKHSRHPNYLGEILMWWGIALAFVCVMPELWYLMAGALINTLMFLFVSVPLADRRQSRKKGFAEYAAATRMLLPIKKPLFVKDQANEQPSDLTASEEQSEQAPTDNG